MIKTAEEITEFSDTESLEHCVMNYCKHSLNFYYKYRELEPSGKRLGLTYRRFIADLENKATVGYYEYGLIPAGLLGLQEQKFVTCLYFMGIASRYHGNDFYYEEIYEDLLSYSNEVFAIAVDDNNESSLRKIFKERITVLRFL